ncbi:MAG: peptide chain release factor N(5)-glutamine methyltransferase [Mariprofundaceae bacterium]|nr:peptide chain release factor N(5)-glutamine methyltransferase [Mariprofundaceae bacterium]
MRVQEILRSASLTLQQAGCDAPRLDAELLLAKTLECDRAWLIAHADEDVPSSVQKTYALLVERRRQREPLAYITGEKEFWSRPFFVTPDVLIPRPETEHLIEAILERFPDTKKDVRFCDIGTGSGCIAVTLACEYSRVQVIATDISHAALHIAHKNAERHGVTSRIEFRQGDMFAALRKQDGPFDAIISNPPYVGQDEMHALEAELSFEPRHALTDETDGLRHLQTLVDQAPVWLKEDGVLVVETGLCGLPSPSPSMSLRNSIHDLSGQLRGGIYAIKER